MNKSIQIYLAHARHFATVLNRLKQQYEGGGAAAKAALKQLDSKWLQIQHAQHWATENAYTVDEAAQLCISFGQEIPALLELRLPLPERLDWYEAALFAARRQQLEATDPVGMLNLLKGLGRTEMRRGNYAQAEGYYLEGLQLARKLGNLEMVGTVLRGLGGIAYQRGDLPLAEKYSLEDLALARQFGKTAQISFTLSNLAMLAGDQGHYERATHLFEESLAVKLPPENSSHRHRLLQNFGNFLIERAQYSAAQKYLNEALSLARSLGQSEAICLILSNLGILFLAKDGYAQAEAVLQEGLALAQQIGYPAFQCYLMNGLGILRTYQGRFDEAAAFLTESQTIASQIGNQRIIMDALLHLGALFYDQGQYSQAAECLLQVLAPLDRVRHFTMSCTALTSLGLVKIKTGDYAEAEKYLEESQNLAQRSQNPVLLGENLLGWAELHLARRALQLAQATWQEVLVKVQLLHSDRLTASAYYGLARTALEQGEVAQAQQLCQSSLTLFEAIGHARAQEVTLWLAQIGVPLEMA